MQGAENLWYKYRLGDEGIKSSPAQKDLGVDERLDTTQPWALTAEKPIVSRAAFKAAQAAG